MVMPIDQGSLGPRNESEMPNVTVHVRGTSQTEGGSVELNFDHKRHLQPLLEDDDGNPIIPDNYCGLRIYQAERILWHNAEGRLVDNEPYGEVLKLDHDSYYGGVEFRGPLTTCAAAHAKPNDNPWYFSPPLTLSGDPQFHLGTVQLTIEFSLSTRVEFIDNGMKRLSLPSLYKKIPKSPDLIGKALRYLERIDGEEGKSRTRHELETICAWYPEACESVEVADWVDDWLPEFRDAIFDKVPERPAPLKLPSDETVRYTGVFHAGKGGHALWVGDDWSGFEKKWKEFSNSGLRLINLETFVAGKTRRYAGVFREGTGRHALWVNDDWGGFEKKWRELSEKNLRLTDIEILSLKSGSRQ